MNKLPSASVTRLCLRPPRIASLRPEEYSALAQNVVAPQRFRRIQRVCICVLSTGLRAGGFDRRAFRFRPGTDAAKAGRKTSCKTFVAVTKNESRHRRRCSPRITLYFFWVMAAILPGTCLSGRKVRSASNAPTIRRSHLEAVSVNGEGADAWSYHAKDSATGAEVTIHLDSRSLYDAAGLLVALRKLLPSRSQVAGKSAASTPTRHQP